MRFVVPGNVYVSVVFNSFLFILTVNLIYPFSANAGLLNRLGSTSPLGLSMSGAGDTTGIHEGAGNAALNPAALVTVDGVSFYIADTIIFTDFAYEQSQALGGQRFEALDEVFNFPEMALAWRIDDHWIIAAEVWAPYGLAADFKDQSPTFPGYNTEFVDLQGVLAVAYQFNEEWSAGASLNIDYTDVRFRLPMIVNGMFIGHNMGDADGVDVGASIGLLWQPGDWRFGMKYSLPNTVDIEGETSFPPSTGITEQSFDSSITIPQRVSAGLAYDLTSWWTAAIDATYTDYEKNDNFVFEFNNLPDTAFPLNWEDVWSFHAGNVFQVTKKLTLKSGAGWLSQGMPDDTLIPSIPDTPGWIVSAGAGYQYNKNIKMDVGVAYAWGERDIGFSPTRAASGELESSLWLASLGFTFSF